MWGTSRNLNECRGIGEGRTDRGRRVGKESVENTRAEREGWREEGGEGVECSSVT